MTDAIPGSNLARSNAVRKRWKRLWLKWRRCSRHNPVLMIFEDAQWIDPTSLELFGRIVDRVPTLRVLLIVTFRPEFEPPWIGRPYVTALSHQSAHRAPSQRHDRSRRRQQVLPASLRLDIIERTDGIPLFVEEMTKAVLEAESEGDARQTAAAVPSSALAVPASLHASLMARLDRLGPAKEVAQIGAAIGREFSHSAAGCGGAKPEAELSLALERLIAAGLLFRQGVPPQATYLFKHALVQDAAYGTLLREPRRALHARIAETLESQFAEIAESRPELLARHCTEAGSSRKPLACGAKPASGRWSVRAGRGCQFSSPAPLNRSRPCLRRPRCVANKSSFRLGLRTLCITPRASARPRQERRSITPAH